MNYLMTFATNRNYIKTMFNRITIWMMIMFCLKNTKRALQRRRGRYFMSANSIVYCRSGFSYIRVKSKAFFYLKTSICFGFFSLLVFLYSSFAFIALHVPFFASFALFAFFIFLHIEHNHIVRLYTGLSIRKK